MKTLTPQQVESFVKMVAQTREREFHCGEFLQHVGEFTRHKLAGLPMSEALALVEHHITVCPECREEYEALKKILRANG